MALQKPKKHIQNTSKSLVDYLNDLEKIGHLVFKKNAPKLSKTIVNFVIKFLPFLAIVSVAFNIPFSLLAIINQLTNLLNLDITVLISSLAICMATVFLGLAIRGLFNRYQGAWKLLFYASLLSTLSIFNYSLTSEILLFFSLLILGWYVLFQIKSYYKK